MGFAQKHLTRRPKVLLLVPQLYCGGGEQAVRSLAGRLASKNCEFHVAAVTQMHAYRDTLPLGVSLNALGARRVRAAGPKILQHVWQLQPDLVLCETEHLNFLVLLLRSLFPRKTRVLVRPNMLLPSAGANRPVPRYARVLYRLLCRRADRMNSRSSAIARDLLHETPSRSEFVTALPNPVEPDATRTAPTAQVDWFGPGPHLLSIGPPSCDKGFDLLLRALCIVRRRFPSATLTIAGYGPEEEELKSECRMLGLDCAVYFAGPVDSPNRFFPATTLFVLSSRHEYLPDALIQAATADLPIAAVPSSGPVVDFLRDRPQTWLASRISAQALAVSIIEALLDLRRQQRSRGDIPAFPPPLNPTPTVFSTSTL